MNQVREKSQYLIGRELPNDVRAQSVLHAYFAHKHMEVPEDIHGYAAELGFHDLPFVSFWKLRSMFLYHQLSIEPSA